MMVTRNNLYNPYTNSFLGVFVNNDLDSIDTKTELILEDIDLYFQPVPDPVTAIIFLAIMTILIALGIYLHLKVLKMLKKENSLLKNLTRNFMIFQLISWPLSVFLLNITNFFHSFPSEISQWVCPILWFLIYFFLNLMTSHSLFSALIRYFFIVHNDRVQSWGKERTKKLFEVMSILMPLLVTLWKANDGSELYFLSFLNKCNGKHHKTFLVETSTLNVNKIGFCEIPDYHEMKDYGEVIIALSKNVICLTNAAMMILMGSNLTEGIIYYLTFSHMSR